MSFVPITTGEIAVGQPIKQATQALIKNNFEDHETRLETLEGANAVQPAITLAVNGQYYVKNNVLNTLANFSGKILGARLIIDKAGTAGTTTIDILKKNVSGGTFTSIFITQPSVLWSMGDGYTSTTGILDPSQVNFIDGDIFRLDIVSSQTDASSFLVRLDYDR